MKRKSIQRIVDYYSEKYKELKNENNGRLAHAGYIFENLIGTLELGAMYWKKKRKEFVESMKTLRTYINLLEEYPEFRDLELNDNQGFFNTLKSTGERGIENYVDEAKRRLEGE